MAEETTKIIRIVVNADRAIDGSASATRALEKLERTTASMDGALTRMEGALNRVGGYLKAQLALMIADVGARLFQMAKASLAAAGNMGELAEQMGITVKGLQGLQFAGVQNRMSLEQLEVGVSQFSRRMGEAAGGSKEMIESLNGMGIKILDVRGKLLPTEQLMQATAVAIMRIEDPAKRAAAAVDLFGKAGVKMLPTLKEIAGGFEDMAEKAKRGGAMISQEAIDKLDKLTDAGSRAQLQLRALFAENAAGPLTETLDFIARKMENLAKIVKGVTGDLSALLAYAANPGLLIGRALSSTPAEKLASDLAKARKEAAGIWDDLGAAKTEGNRAGLMSGYAAAMARVADLERQQNVMNVGGKVSALPSDPDNLGVVIPFAPKGTRNPLITGAGKGDGDRLAKVLQAAGRELDEAKAFAEAAEQGAAAVAKLEVHFKSLKTAQDVFEKTANDNSDAAKTLASRLEATALAAMKLKNLGDFNLGTVELEKANQLLAAENGLINASVEVRARELALIKLKHEAQSKGLDGNNAAEKIAIDRRHTAIEQNERLKAQGDELRKANELWTAPLKSALESIQNTAADAFEGMLESGKFSFQALGDVVKRTITRMIAEFAALAVIRPMMGSMIGGLQGIGLVSGSTASSLGYGGSGSGAGAGGGFSLPSSGGGFGSMFGGGLGDWLNTPFTGPYAGVSPSAMQGVPMLSGAAGAGITPLGAFGAAAGIGMGAYQLATSKSTAGTIGGIGTMLGAGISLIPGMAPIGMGISLLSSILPGLFGGGEAPPLPPLSGSNLRFDPSAGGYTMADTQQNGGASMAGQHGYIGSTLDALFGAVGGLTDPSRAFGASVWNNQREGTTSTYLISPTQGSNQQTYDESGDPSKAIDRLIAKVFYDSVQNNAAMNASPTLRTAFGNREPTGTQQISELLSLIKTYDQLGKATVTAKSALEEINAQFAGLTAGANMWGLSLAPIIAEQGKITKRYAQDFIDGMIDPMAAAMRALDDERKDSLASAEYIRDNVKDVFVDMERITQYWNTRRLDLETQYQQQSVGQLEALVRRLTYGDLANASPDMSLAGTRGTYEATLAQARAGSGAARNNLAAAGEAYASSGRSYFASSAEYEALIAGIRRDVLDVIGSSGGGTGTAANGNSNALTQTTAELHGMVRALVEAGERREEQMTALIAQLQRRG